MTQTELSSAKNEAASAPQPHGRQILVSLGNRYVVFGSGASLPDQRLLGLRDVKEKLPRVAEERDGVEARIVQSLVVEGFEVRPIEGAQFGDVVIVDGQGRSVLVEIKVGDRAFAGIDLGQAWAELGPPAEAGERREIWAFDLERLTLGIVWSEGLFSPSFAEFPALSVWEFNHDGSVFDRRSVINDIDDWLRRVESLYADVESWVREDQLTTRRDRTILMSEELMQRFAVPDRDMPILDIMDGAKPVVSMVPVGLWLLGFAGMIDVITRSGTFRLGALPPAPEPRRWVLIDPKFKKRTDWSKEAFRATLGLVPAGE